MTRKRKRQSGQGRPKPSRPSRQSPEFLEREGLQALEAGHWRDAIQALKTLLKDDAAGERTPQRRLALAEAYAGRARELAGKGMLKEAAVIWENRAALGPEITPSIEHATLRLRLGDVEPLIALWSRTDGMTRDERERAGEQLAAAMLAKMAAGDQSLLERLASDDPVRCHAGPAFSALTAYCNTDQPALEAALAAIPFRSPYRSWALLLKALVRLETEPDAAREMLARISDQSAFAPLRRAAESALLPDAERLAALADLGPRQAEFVSALCGWSTHQLALARGLAALDTGAARRQALLQLLKRHRDLLGADWVKTVSLRLMPRGQGPFARRPSSWRALSRRECALLEAWDAEAEGNPWSVLEAWENLAAELAAEQRPEGPKDPRSRLEIALVLRRAEAHFKLLEIEQPDEDPESPETLAAEQLERSLLWDPEHRETYLGLITWYRRARRLRDARRLLAQAQQRWPQDMTVLEAALETALASNAFKKAVGIARQMLAIDPINSSARRRLVDAHIEHAAKQVPKARAALARKELAEARAWAERGAGLEPVRHQLALLDGLVVLALIDPGEGKASLTELLEQRGDGVVAQLELMLAADRLALRQSDIAERLALAQRKPGNRDELLAVLTLLRTYLERTNGYTYGLMDRLGTMLSGAPWKQLECGELELACETLRAFRLPTIRQAAARAGLKRWPRTPMLEYHLYDARFAEGGFPSAAELEKMERALARAEAAGDMRAAERLRGLVHQYLPFGRMPAPPFFDDPAPPAREPDELGDLEGSTGLDLLMDALDQLPLKQALDATGMPRHLKRQVLKVARDAGEEVAVEMLKAIVRSAAAEAGDSPLPKRQPRSMPTGGRGGAPANDQEETDNPRQFDLF